MKKLFLVLAAAIGFQSSYADEGMWIPSLIGKNYAEMKKLGLKLSQDDIYNINKASLKDAIIQFAGGCTGEIISPEGLILTNHHCGYGAIAALSTVEKNYLDNGYWAKSKAEELPAPGVTALFLQDISDVTSEIQKAVGTLKGEAAEKALTEAISKIEKEKSIEGKILADVKEYFNGNQYLLLRYKKYTDVRFVATPPKSLGKYGGDTDNWMWPRHTADFSIFRVYANKDNEPAAYAKENVPLKAKKYLPISIKGSKEGDYAMIMGYPGRTNRYEISYGIDLALKETNPSIVAIRTKRLAIMKEHMDADKSVYLKLTSQYASIANYWKYFIGQTEQLKRLNVVNQKIDFEKQFTQWSINNNKGYNDLVNQYNQIYKVYEPYAKASIYYREAFRASALARIAASSETLLNALKRNASKDSIQYYVKQFKTARTANLNAFDYNTDKDVFEAMTEMFYKDVPANQQPSIYKNVILDLSGKEKLSTTFHNYTNYVYRNTSLLDSQKFETLCANINYDVLKQDPAVQYALSFVKKYEKEIAPKAKTLYEEKENYSKQFVKGIMEMEKGKKFYPDANSTMRVTYGRVLGYEPQDAVIYKYYTTMEGLIAKYKPQDDEFDLPQQLLDMYKKKDYGPYADKDGKLHTCFITNNDITGGNSGSPVINGNGELIGCAFDGNWEAMSGDIAFDSKYKRTICVDVRFILYLIDKMGNAQNLIKEMDIRK